MTREFCAYLKNEEHGKLTTRAIVSANTLLRMPFTIIEKLHLELGKIIEGSTISIGGEEMNDFPLCAQEQHEKLGQTKRTSRDRERKF